MSPCGLFAIQIIWSNIKNEKQIKHVMSAGIEGHECNKMTNNYAKNGINFLNGNKTTKKNLTRSLSISFNPLHT